MGVLSSVFWGVVLLGSLVFVHEGGHFLAARAFGMRVTEFFLGMPCRLKLSRRSRSRGTEVGVTPLLLGGYTRICGMDGAAGPRTAAVLACVAGEGRIRVAEVAERVGCTFDEALAELALLADWASVEPYYDAAAGEHEGQKTWPASFQTVARDDRQLTAFDSGHDLSRPGSTAAGEPHAVPGGELSFLEAERARTYQGKGFVARAVTLAAGPAVNIALGLALLAGALTIGGVTVSVNLPQVGSVQAGSMAESCGIVAGDTIDEVAGAEVSTWTDMGEALRAAIAQGEPFDVTYTHEGAQVTATADPSAFEGQALFGVGATTTTYHPSLDVSLRAAWSTVVLTAQSVVQLLTPTHTAEVVSQSTSVMGISVMASEAASAGVASFVSLMAAISLSLGFMNLIPIPPLDGGKLLIELAQLVLRRRVSERVQNGLSYVGLALFMALFVAVLGQDIIRFVLGG